MKHVGFFLGAIFFLGASSFLYFRLYTDINLEKSKYMGLSKLGLSFNEMKKVASVQIAVLFFVPKRVSAVMPIEYINTIIDVREPIKGINCISLSSTAPKIYSRKILGLI